MSERGFLGSARVIGACTMASRVLGMVRDILSSHVFGAGAVWDAFGIAYRVPNLFRRLFGEGALTAAFVPPFVSRLEAGDRDGAERLLRQLSRRLALTLLGFVVLGIAATFLLPSDPKTSLIASYLRIMLPYLLFICLAALFGGALNGLRHFFLPAFAPVILNGIWILMLIVFRSAPQTQAGTVVSWTIFAGGLFQLALLFLALRLSGFRLFHGASDSELETRDPGLRDVASRFFPVVLGLSLVQINELVDSVIAELCVPGDGAVSALYYANQLTQLPLSIIGTSVATAVFPSIAASVASERSEETAQLVRKAVGAVVSLALPATVGLILFSRPIVRLIFEHGAFGPQDTTRTAAALAFYAGGLWCYCLNQVQTRVFYAHGDTRTPVRISTAMVVLNVILNLALVGPLREAGIALATSISGFLSFVLLQIILRRRHPGLPLGLFPALARSALLSAAMGAACLGAEAGLNRVLPGDTIPLQAVRLAAIVALGAGLVLAAGRWIPKR